MLANGDQKKSRSYLLAVEDTEFLLRDEMRSLRFAMEYGKPELLLRDWGVRSTVVVFGSANSVSRRSSAHHRKRAERGCDRQCEKADGADPEGRKAPKIFANYLSDDDWRVTSTACRSWTPR